MTDRTLFPNRPQRTTPWGTKIEDVPRSRSSHPDTSHEAEKTVDLPKWTRHAMGAVKTWPGSTAAELDRSYGTRGGQVRKRLNDLRLAGLARKGKKRKCRVTGRSAYEWWPE